MMKNITLCLEDCAIQLEVYSDSDLVTVRLNDFVKDEERSQPHHEVHKENNVVEVYPSVDEVKEIIKALQLILPEEEQE